MIFSERVKYLRGVCYPSLPQHCARRSGTLLEPIARFRLVALRTQAFLSEVWPELSIQLFSALNLHIVHLLGFCYHFPFIIFSPSGGGACLDLLSFCQLLKLQWFGSLYNRAVLIHFSANLTYQLQILKCLFPSLVIYTLECHSRYCDLMVFSCLQVQCSSIDPIPYSRAKLSM